MIIGIDVGGANTKAATSDGSFVTSIHAPLWKNKATLYDVLHEITREMDEIEITSVGAVMTGEICGCFETKRKGVLYIKKAVCKIFDDVKFLDHRSILKKSSAVDGDPVSFASTNWLASTRFIADEYKDVIFVDIGSTTTDVIPIKNGRIKVGRSDLERLKSGELIYSGILRTNVSCLLDGIKMRGGDCKISSEHFSTTADVYLIIGRIKKEDIGCESLNRYCYPFTGEEEKNRISAMRRLARVLCSDLEEIGADNVVHIAEQVEEAQVNELITSLERISEKYGLKNVVSVGIGDFIAEESSEALNLDFLSLSSVYGKGLSAVFPAYAVAKLLERERNRPTTKSTCTHPTPFCAHPTARLLPHGCPAIVVGGGTAVTHLKQASTNLIGNSR
ncbi:MAG: H4MPT-linked C1 transfer pathway protein [Methanosarcinales archaeon]|nr:H4MPT-linked C1 transfer pathway protein [Methanosarcinales archaeon]